MPAENGTHQADELHWTWILIIGPTFILIQIAGVVFHLKDVVFSFLSLYGREM